MWTQFEGITSRPNPWNVSMRNIRRACWQKHSKIPVILWHVCPLGWYVQFGEENHLLLFVSCCHKATRKEWLNQRDSFPIGKRWVEWKQVSSQGILNYDIVRFNELTFFNWNIVWHMRILVPFVPFSNSDILKFFQLCYMTMFIPSPNCLNMFHMAQIFHSSFYLKKKLCRKKILLLFYTLAAKYFRLLSHTNLLLEVAIKLCTWESNSAEDTNNKSFVECHLTSMPSLPEEPLQ